jgi:hypothetical protein
MAEKEEPTTPAHEKIKAAASDLLQQQGGVCPLCQKHTHQLVNGGHAHKACVTKDRKFKDNITAIRKEETKSYPDQKCAGCRHTKIDHRLQAGSLDKSVCVRCDCEKFEEPKKEEGVVIPEWAAFAGSAEMQKGAGYQTAKCAKCLLNREHHGKNKKACSEFKPIAKKGEQLMRELLGEPRNEDIAGALGWDSKPDYLPRKHDGRSAPLRPKHMGFVAGINRSTADKIKANHAEKHPCSHCGGPNYGWIISDICSKCVHGPRIDNESVESYVDRLVEGKDK